MFDTEVLERPPLVSREGGASMQWRHMFAPLGPDVYVNGRDDTEPVIAETVVWNHNEIDPIEPGDVVLMGFPQDEGVERNSGRTGAHSSPDLIRRFLGKFRAPLVFDSAAPYPVRIKDIGNLRCEGKDLESTQHFLGESVSMVLCSGALPIILGGGHETAFGHFLGYALAGRQVSILNVDAHFDVRPLCSGKGHSGSPFRQAAEHSSGKLIPHGYACIGIQETVNPRHALEYIRSHKFNFVPLERAIDSEQLGSFLDAFFENSISAGADTMLTIDLDSIKQADAPGVSAPCPIGFTSEQAVAVVRSIVMRGVTSVDIVEYNPQYDLDDRPTARLAAYIIYRVIDDLSTQKVAP